MTKHTFLIPALLLGALTASAQKAEWQGNIDWSARNSDAGGSVDCQVDYIQMGVPYCIAVGGRSCVMNEAVKAAFRGDEARAYALTLMTQCHNGHARQTIADAGPSGVARYLRDNYQPTGPDLPNIVVPILGNIFRGRSDH
jgi:hypothetical protein